MCAFLSVISENDGVSRRTDIPNESETVVRDFSLPRSYTEIPPSQNICKQDQYNYARWISVRIQDLLMLPVTCPQLDEQFEAGHFVVQVSGREFSRIHYDQAHEQSNKTIKSISGPINFVNRANDELQRRWEIA